MNDISSLLNSLWPPPIAPEGEDSRRLARAPLQLQGRLAFGGANLGLVGCEILDLSASGARVETFAELAHLPDIVTLEFGGMYNRARCCWKEGRQIGLAFVREDMRAA